MSERWIEDLEAQLTAAGAKARPKRSKDSHTIWEFPDGFRIWMQSRGKHRTHHARTQKNAEATVRRAIARHGVATPARPREPGHRPRDIETWTPKEPSAPPMSALIRKDPPMDTPAATATTPIGAYACDQCDYRGHTENQLRGHKTVHKAARPCPTCGQLSRGGRHFATCAARAAGATTTPAITAPTPVGDVSLAALVRGLQQQVQAVVAAATRIEEENKMLRRDAGRAQSRLEKIERFMRSSE